MFPVSYYIEQMTQQAASILPGLWPFGPDGFLARIAEFIGVVLGIAF